MKFRTKMVIGISVFVILFTIYIGLLLYQEKAVPDAWLYCVYGANLGEGGLLAWITRGKIKRETPEDGETGDIEG